MLLEIVRGRQQVSGLLRPHRAVGKVEFCHVTPCRSLAEQPWQPPTPSPVANASMHAPKKPTSLSCFARSMSPRSASWERPHIEQPHGGLPVDTQNPGLHRDQGSNIQHLVGGTGLEPVTSSV